MISHIIWAVGGLGLPRFIAALLALFGTERFSERGYRLLGRPPLAGSAVPSSPQRKPRWRKS